MRKWYPWILVVIASGFSLAVETGLTNQVPTHWSLTGQVNGWSMRWIAAWVIPAIMALLTVVLPLAGTLSKSRRNFELNRPTYDLFANAVITALCILHVGMLGADLGWPIAMERLTPVMIGALFVLVGNLLPGFNMRKLFRIQAPTMRPGDPGWDRAHHATGYMFVAIGLLLILVGAVPSALGLPLVLTALVVAIAIPVAYRGLASDEVSQ